MDFVPDMVEKINLWKMEKKKLFTRKNVIWNPRILHHRGPNEKKPLTTLWRKANAGNQFFLLFSFFIYLFFNHKFHKLCNNFNTQGHIMAVGDACVFPGFLTPVPTQLSFQSHWLPFSHASAEVRGKITPERKFASTWSQTTTRSQVRHTHHWATLAGTWGSIIENIMKQDVL